MSIPVSAVAFSSALSAAEAPSSRLQAGTAAFRATARAMFVGGFCTFAMLYGAQPLMPMFAHDFGLTPAASSGVVSMSTGALALALIPASLLSDRFGRRALMIAALSLGALLTLLSAFVDSFGHFLLLRALFGAALAGLPAVAMAYLSEEVDGKSLGHSMGLYIAGNALGGMCGRFMSSVLADHFGWRGATLALALLGCLGAWLFWRWLPASRHFQSRRQDFARMRREVGSILGDGGLPWLFLTAFLLMGCFVSLYNYLGFRLLAAPFHLSQSMLAWVFSLYVVGIWSSAWVGRLADHLGRRNVLWLMVAMMLAGLALTLADTLWLMAPGIALFTFGFFAGHSVASSWIGLRAREAKALASALYLGAYYLGSSVYGWLSGLMWGSGGWHGVASALAVGLLALLAVALWLRRLQPLPQNA
ncbi:MFS transporter [Chromobacterium sp. IIBBL 290-4]|uniref:MFS transporter n=1 Tax=Chromobacterium sp. IIBBL 290-4 TaxID=2953890 RepID=UPI0020B6A007|nr:MFS transporter [Chromobacterium sp. IIBBL 290-4]UTH72701.1 MFS transporter [Chromobacterium sp. IIBBL 290-4]